MSQTHAADAASLAHDAAGGHAVHAPKHPYHLVEPSPWPIVGAIAAGLLTGGGVLYMHGHGWALLIIGLLRARRHGRVVARRDPRGDVSGLPHADRAARHALWHGVVHRLGGDVFRRVFLGVLRIEPVSGGWGVATQGHPSLRPIRVSVSEHTDPVVVGQ